MTKNDKDGKKKIRRSAAGKMGENIVINELFWNGWVPLNANLGLGNTPNIDIIAARGARSIHIQVKATTDSANDEVEVAHGRRERYFNSKDGPLAHFTAFICIRSPKDYECYIVPVDVAEKEVARCYDIWSKQPKRNNEKRSESFRASIIFKLNKNRPSESHYREKWKQYLDAWDLLER